MPTANEHTTLIAEIIERYVAEHPRAADTPDGIRAWWVAPHRYDASLADVQVALEFLVESCRLSRSTLPEGTVIYARALRKDEDETTT